jgi:predicted negative regulator of RcsB-dependent stress response
MSSYHEEQATLDALKAWWARWGNLVTWLVFAIAVAVGGWRAWQYWQQRQAGEAVALYERAQQAIEAGDKAMMTRTASDVEAQFSRTPYAQMTALLVARGLYDAGDVAGAKAQLQWVADHARDDAYADVARVRLAGILLDEKSYDAGLKLVDQPATDAFKGLFADRRGDLLAAQGKTGDARHAYQIALDAFGTDNPSARQMVQFKLDALGAAG